MRNAGEKRGGTDLCAGTLIRHDSHNREKTADWGAYTSQRPFAVNGQMCSVVSAEKAARDHFLQCRLRFRAIIPG